MDDDTKQLLSKYKEQVAQFRKMCIQYGNHTVFEEIDFSDFSVGFFIALGVTDDSGTGELYYDAFRLSTICRYDLQYWDGETL